MVDVTEIDEKPRPLIELRAVQVYQIIAQTILGVLGVGGYVLIVILVITHQGEWTSFQQNQIASVLSFLAGTIVAGVFGYAFGSSFGSMSKDAAMERHLSRKTEKEDSTAGG